MFYTSDVAGFLLLRVYIVLFNNNCEMSNLFVPSAVLLCANNEPRYRDK